MKILSEETGRLVGPRAGRKLSILGDLLLSMVVLSLPAALAGPVEPQARTRPNILFIFADDHAVQAISAYGSRINQTPRIDRIAEKGAVFLNSFCANSICGPSRANILTGKHSHINGFRRNGNCFDGSQVTFPKLLQQAGYQTAMLGKWHLSSDPTGFDYFEILPGQGNYYNPVFLQEDGSSKRYEGYCTDLVTDLALDWLKQGRDPDKPFLLMCQHKAPHRNWAPAARHLSLFDGVEVPEPETLFDDYSGRSKLLKENEMTLRDCFHWGHDAKFHGENLLPDYFAGEHKNGEYERMTDAQKAAWDAHYEPLNEAFLKQVAKGELSDREILSWKYQRYIKDYLACVAAVDENVGRMLDYLDESGLFGNTVVIYSSDQGFYLGEHGWYDKRWMFEESLKMPFLIRWPGVLAPGTRSEALIQNIDYAPTFLEMAGAKVPAEIQGRNLLPVLENAGRAPADWRQAIYYAYYENAAVHNVPLHDGVRTQDLKLIRFPRTGEWQLFDLKQDPLELKSIHDDPEAAARLAGMQKRYQDLRRFYDVNSAIIPTTRGDEAWWRDRQKATNDRVERGDVDLVFIGDSITQGFEGAGAGLWEQYYGERRAVNLGFSGDRTEHLLWRLQYGNLKGIEPKAAVVMIGTNNTGHSMQDPEEVAAGIREVLDLIQEKSPQTRVLLLGIFPRGRTPDDLGRINNEMINQIIRRFADERVRYLDIGPVFLEADGTLSEKVMPDALHLSEEGYRRWVEAIEPALKAWGV
ncbi:MAG: sulfatase/phosphatase domain-containing protein [Planctomycetota bacterium]